MARFLVMDLQSPACERRPLSSSEAAFELGVCERTLRRYIASDRIRHHRLPGGHYRIPAEAIDEFWAANEKARAPAALPDRDQHGGHTAPSRRPAARRSPPLGREPAPSYDLSPEHLAQLRARVAANPSR
jgi:excisionase family DNA binding protein